MKRFFAIVARNFFDNQYCEYCGRSLGFDVTSLNLLVIDTDAQSWFRARDGRRYKTCGNAVNFDACNWLIGKTRSPNNYAMRANLIEQFLINLKLIATVSGVFIDGLN